MYVYQRKFIWEPLFSFYCNSSTTDVEFGQFQSKINFQDDFLETSRTEVSCFVVLTNPIAVNWSGLILWILSMSFRPLNVRLHTLWISLTLNISKLQLHSIFERGGEDSKKMLKTRVEGWCHKTWSRINKIYKMGGRQACW